MLQAQGLSMQHVFTPYSVNATRFIHATSILYASIRGNGATWTGLIMISDYHRNKGAWLGYYMYVYLRFRRATYFFLSKMYS